MKQTALMFVLLLLGTGGAILRGPFMGVAVYYLLAVLRPQYIWEWALTVDVRWSFYVGLGAILSTIFYLPRLLQKGKSFSRGHVTMLIFAICVTLSHIFAFDKDLSWPWYWLYLKIVILFFCSSLVVREFRQIRILYLIAVLSIGYLAYELNFVYLTDGRLDIYHVGYGGLDSNGAGLMIAMGVPMAYFSWQGHSRWWRWGFLGLIPFMLHAVLMSYSRGAMLALALVTPLVLVRSQRKMAMSLCMAGLLILLPIFAGKEIRARFFSIREYQEDRSSQSRLESWTAALKIAKDFPLFGVGVRNSDLFSYQYGADHWGRAIHSQYLQIAADSGLPAITFYLLTLVMTWGALRRFQQQVRESESENHRIAYNLACGVEGAMAVFCIGSTFLSLDVFELPYLLILLALKLPQIFGQENMVPSPARTIAEPARRLRIRQEARA